MATNPSLETEEDDDEEERKNVLDDCPLPSPANSSYGLENYKPLWKEGSDAFIFLI